MPFSFKAVGVLVLLVLCSFLVPLAQAFPNSPFPRPSCRVAPDGPTLPVLWRMSNTRGAVQHHANVVGEMWPQVGDAGVLRGCAAKALA
jgi:hypothetical protein